MALCCSTDEMKPWTGTNRIELDLRLRIERGKTLFRLLVESHSFHEIV